MTVAVYGGSFNPPHRGHLVIARTVLERGLADRVWFLPCRRNPLKPDGPAFSESDRAEMLRLAIADEPAEFRRRMEVCELEFQMPEPSYTIDTLREIKRRNPDTALRLLIGGDSLNSFGRWREPDAIAAIAPLIVYPRPGERADTAAAPPGTTILDGVEEDAVSSSAIRDSLAKGIQPPHGSLNKHVLDYIMQKK